MTLKIGALAQSTRTNPPTIRYYEEIGLLPMPAREAGGQRRYGEEDRRRLTFIRQCREFGFPIEQVRSLVALTEDRERPCTDARAIAADHLGAVREKLAELRKLERSLADFIQACDAACAGGPGPDCVVLQEMANPPSRRRKPDQGRNGR